MRILIATDMEGITGVTSWEHVSPGTAEYERMRAFMTVDVNAAVAGALEGGADEVLVADGHDSGSNILIEKLDSRARLASGSPSPYSMMQGIEAGIDAVMFVGYHARMGTERAVLDHTWSSTLVHAVRLNGDEAGEYTFNALIAAELGIPVIMCSGDQTACAQIREQLGVLETAVVKEATGRFSATLLSPAESAERIAGAARTAVRRLMQGDRPALLKVEWPCELEVEFQSSEFADRAGLFPGVSRSRLRVSLHARTALELLTLFRSLLFAARG